MYFDSVVKTLRLVQSCKVDGYESPLCVDYGCAARAVERVHDDVLVRVLADFSAGHLRLDAFTGQGQRRTEVEADEVNFLSCQGCVAFAFVAARPARAAFLVFCSLRSVVLYAEHVAVLGRFLVLELQESQVVFLVLSYEYARPEIGCVGGERVVQRNADAAVKRHVVV